MPYAIIRDGGRQFKVEAGQELLIDYRGEDVQDGAEITFTEVLAIGEGESIKIGAPLIAGATVTATVIDDDAKGPKLVIQKFRRRKNSKRKTGHRQIHTLVKIGAIA